MHSRIRQSILVVAAGMGMATLIVGVTIGAAADSKMRPTSANARSSTQPPVDTSDNLHVPADYRTTYQFLGTWAVEPEKAASPKQLHNVYGSPSAIAAYRRDGHLPAGTVLVKEVFEAATRDMTTGKVSHAETLKGWFVMVKDNNAVYAGNKLWGDGWGWSWFDAQKPSRTTSTDYKKDCEGCHIPARASDWVYVDGYPPLKR